MSSSVAVVIAGRERSITDCADALRRYPGATINDYDRPGPGDPTVLTRQEVARTRVLKSRISDQQLGWFVDRATRAPWPPADADLRHAEPHIRNGLYDQLEDFYRHFEDDAPDDVARAKISKVLHVKRPAAIPILDSEVTEVYRQCAEEAASRYPRLNYRKAAYWPAIRDDLIANTESDAFIQLRAAIGTEGTLGANIDRITDLRLLDMLTWQWTAR